MQGSPQILSVKRPRAKPKGGAPLVTPTVSKSRKKAVVVKQAGLVATPAAVPDPTPMIATMAYFLAAERQFAPGHELDDWLEAERRVAESAAT